MPKLIVPAAADGKTWDKQREIAELQDFIANKPDYYKGGMTEIALGHVMRETAKYYCCDFAEIRDQELFNTALSEQKDSKCDILLCSPRTIKKGNKSTDLKALTSTLAAIKKNSKPYKQIFIPIGALDYDVNHAMTLAIEGNNAYIFEQFGGTRSYGEVKQDIKQALSALGYNIKINPNPLTPTNRLDCATVSSKVIFDAMNADSIEAYYQKTCNTSPLYSYNDIDGHHRIDQQFARLALKDIQNGNHNNHNQTADIILLQELLTKASYSDLESMLSLTEEFWKSDDKARFVTEYKPQKKNKDNINVDDNVNNSTPDDGWKAEVREAVKKAKTELKTNFEEYEDEEHPERLCFRDGDDKIIFSSKNSVAVEGDIQTFRTVCETAKNLGFKSINFGKFEEHPEFKARLYLACLEKDMKMNNAPQLEDLKEFPEYPQILKLYVPKKRKELAADLKKKAAEFNKARTAAQNDQDYKRLTKELQEAKKTRDNDAIEKAKEALSQNASHKALEEARHQYKDAMKLSINFYIQYGSENSKPDQTPEQRRQKVENHLENYKAEEFFSKEFITKKELAEGKTAAPRQAKREEINKYSPAQKIAREIMNVGKER